MVDFMKRLSLIILLSLTQGLLAQDLLPATSEDLQDFDRQITKMKESSKVSGKGSAKDNFGAVVKEEARKLKDSSGDEKNKFGSWVSSQRKKTSQGQPSDAGSSSSNNLNAGGNRRAQPDKGQGKKK